MPDGFEVDVSKGNDDKIARSGQVLSETTTFVASQAEIAMIYGVYEVDIEQVQPGSWKAHIRRSDGKPISTAPFGSDNIAVLSTKTFYSKEDALQSAKDLIDRGHMK